MSLVMTQAPSSRLVTIHLTGRLQKRDYESFVPAVERAIEEHGKVRILVEMHDFHGFSPGALWEDLKFDVKHFNHIDRIAMVGDTKWQKWMATFCKPFTTAQIRYFEQDQLMQAQDWLESA